MDIKEAIEHGRRWLAAGWQWKPGQFAIPRWSDGVSILVTSVTPDGVPCSVGTELTGSVPDPRDPGTRGHMLEQVREAWNCDKWRRLTIECAGPGWCVIIRNARHRPPSRAQPGWDLDGVAHPRYRNTPGPFGENVFDTEAEALLAAFEAAT